MNSYWYLQLWFSTARFILAFLLSSSSLLLRNLAPIVCKLYTYLINPIRHVVSELLIHIPIVFCTVFFLLSLALWTPVKTSFPKVIEVSSFFPFLDPILTFSKCFHIWLCLWLHHYWCIREEETMTCGVCIGFSCSCEQSDSWLELGTSGFAILSVELLLQNGPGLQRQL